MTTPRTQRPHLLATLSLFALVTLSAAGRLQAQSASPPSEPPADWAPVSINLEDVPYPHPVEFLGGEWPRLSLVRAMAGNARSIDTLVNGWPQIETKAMVIGGAEDGPNFPELARRAAEALQNAELVLIPNVGHNPHLEAPELFNPELIRFLSSDGIR